MHIFYLLGTVLLFSIITNSSATKLGLLVRSESTDNFDNSRACFRKGTCQPLQNITYFGTFLPYTHFSEELTKDCRSFFEIQHNIDQWFGLRSVPDCWGAIKPLLCAVHVPKCENGLVSLPSQEMCLKARGLCEAVAVKLGWPCYLQCDNNILFPSSCRNPLQEIKFNTSSKSYTVFSFQSVQSARGLTFENQCQKPAYIESFNFKDLHFIRIMACFSFAFTVFTLITLLNMPNEFTTEKEGIIFFNNLCWMIVSLCWIVQFFSGAKKEILCLDDGASQQLLPESGQYLCGFSFVLIYFFSVAGVVNFVYLTYFWYSGFPENGSLSDSMRKKEKYSFICVWCIPLFLIVTMAITQARGMCFKVSNINIGFIVVNIAYSLGGYFLARSLLNLKRMLNSPELKSRKKLYCMMRDRGFIALCLVVLSCTALFCVSYDLYNSKEWKESLKDYTDCLSQKSGQSSLNGTESSYDECVLKSKPNVYVFVLYMFNLLMFGNILSSLLWNKSFLNVFKYYFCSCCAECCDGLKSDYVPPPPPKERELPEKDSFKKILSKPLIHSITIS